MRIISLSLTIMLACMPVFSIAQNKPKNEPKEVAPAVQIYFDLNKSKIKKSETTKLEQLVTDLKSKKEFQVVLTGHTDSLGSDDYNLRLSEERVDNVYDYLLSVGLDSNVMRKSYFGKSKPREGNDKEDKRAKNRRVEITIIEKEKPVEKPKPKPVAKDTCGRDTTFFIGQGISMTMNICEFKRICKKGAEGCITVTRKTEIDEIFESGVALKTSKGEGFVWAGIFDFKFPGDTCMANPSSFSYSLDLDDYKKARLGAQKDKGGNLEADRAVRPKVTRTKQDIKVNCAVKCGGQVLIAGPAGKSKVAKIKDKTRRAEEIYVVSGSPVTIIPAIKKGSSWYVNYSNITDPKLYIRTTDGQELISDIDMNKIRKTKAKGELRKKYKVKTKHLKG